MASTALVSSARSVLAKLFSKRSDALLPFIPKSIKLVFLLLVLLNSASFPFTWHARVWYYPLQAYYHVYTRGKLGYWKKWRKELEAAGGISGLRSKIKRRALFDDCDYNMHLSNSCYAKNTDPARMKYCIDAFAPVYATGTYMALGASHYVFLKEIPLGSEYTMEVRAGGWGDKWLYLITEYIIYPKRRSSKSKSKSKSVAAGATDKLKSGNLGPIPSISASVSGTTTPSGSGDAPGSAVASGTQTPDLAKKISHRPRDVRPDGGVVCSVAVTEYCFKIGRVTVPPRIAMFVSLNSPKEEDRARAMRILQRKDKGKSWLAGGWKEEADAEELGRDIGRHEHDAATFVGDVGVTSEAWFEKARAAMERATEGLNEL